MGLYKTYVDLKEQHYSIYIFCICILITFTFIGISLILFYLEIIPKKYVINCVAFSIVITFCAYLVTSFLQFRKIKKKEERFASFLRYLAEGKRSGVPLPQSIQMATKSDYGQLNEDIKLMAAQLSWGIPFPRVIEIFMERNRDSALMCRALGIVVEAYNSGGDIATTLDAVAGDVRVIKELEASRKAKMQQQMVIMYAIFVVFLIIIVSLNFLLKPLSKLGQFQMEEKRPTEGFSPAYYRHLFLSLAIIQAIFNGLIAGEIGEGSIIAGFKHSFIMLIPVIIMFTVVIPSPGYEISFYLEDSYSPGEIIGDVRGFALTVTDPDGKPVGDGEVIILISGKEAHNLNIKIEKKAVLKDGNAIIEELMVPNLKGKYDFLIQLKTCEKEPCEIADYKLMEEVTREITIS